MKRITRKLSGPAKARFLVQFIGAEPGIDAGVALRLADRCNATFTSLRLRKSHALVRIRRAPLAPAKPQPATAGQVATAAPAANEPAQAFDPYAFGLVPVFQREGRDGLLARLAEVDRIEDLRAMAKTQQIVLPSEFRSGDVSAVAVRQAIAEAVAKRIADRRAAAG